VSTWCSAVPVHATRWRCITWCLSTLHVCRIWTPILTVTLTDSDLDPLPLPLTRIPTQSSSRTPIWTRIHIQTQICTRSATRTAIRTRPILLLVHCCLAFSDAFLLAFWHRKFKVCLHVSSEICLVNFMRVCHPAVTDLQLDECRVAKATNHIAQNCLNTSALAQMCFGSEL